jgi:hypothetical protein
MEFFIPGLLLFLLFIGIAFFVAPKATPMIAAILSIIFLIYGVREHSKMFASEYRLSTWQDGLKMYAPAIMIMIIIIFVIYSILAFFTGGSVPVPSMPNMELPTMNSLTNSINDAKNTIANGLNGNNTLLGPVTKNNINKNLTNNGNNGNNENNGNNRNNTNKKNGKGTGNGTGNGTGKVNFRPSLLETI